MEPDYFIYYVYILASKPSGTIYIGITNDLTRRTREHQNFIHPKCFTAKYKVTQLVHIEKYDNVMNAILREKKLKKWHRKWKLELITKTNPWWDDLSREWQHIA